MPRSSRCSGGWPAGRSPGWRTAGPLYPCPVEDASDLLTDRDAWSAVDCSIDAALGVVGTRSAMLLMREAFLGTRRFDDFARRVGLTDAMTATRLRDLVAAGLLVKRPYQADGQRARMEYRLTEQGRDLLPALLALMQWGDRWLSPDGVGSLRVLHRGCGAALTVGLQCGDGHLAGLAEVQIVAAPGDDEA